MRKHIEYMMVLFCMHTIESSSLVFFFSFGGTAFLFGIEGFDCELCQATWLTRRTTMIGQKYM